MKKIFLLFAIFTATSVNAAQLNTDYSISVLAINGKTINNRQQIDETHYQLPDARVQLIVQVDGRFRSGSDAKYFNSKPYVLTFESTQDVLLKMPRYSKSLTQVERAFAEGEPRWRLVDNQGNNIAYTTQRLPGKKAFFPMQICRGYWLL